MEPNFEGHEPRECGEHRTVGPHRAWCFECTEWCYPDMDWACKGCRLGILDAHADLDRIFPGTAKADLPVYKMLGAVRLSSWLYPADDPRVRGR